MIATLEVQKNAISLSLASQTDPFNPSSDYLSPLWQIYVSWNTINNNNARIHFRENNLKLLTSMLQCLQKWSSTNFCDYLLKFKCQYIKDGRTRRGPWWRSLDWNDLKALLSEVCDAQSKPRTLENLVTMSSYCSGDVYTMLGLTLQYQIQIQQDTESIRLSVFRKNDTAAM